MRSVRQVFAAVFVLLALGATAWAAGGRAIETTENSDYFGFDLRTEQNVSLDRCKSICLGDSSCRAFTYNTKAKWCFLKSDFNKLKPFSGAVAGKIVNLAGEPDIGAPRRARLRSRLDGRGGAPLSPQPDRRDGGRHRRP